MWKYKHRPKWNRPFELTENFGTIHFSDILLYSFELSPLGVLTKHSREYLQTCF